MEAETERCLHCEVEEPEIHGDMVAANGLIIKVQDFIKRELRRRADNHNEKKRDLRFFLSFCSCVCHVGVLACSLALIWLILTRKECSLEVYGCKDAYKTWSIVPVIVTASVLGICYSIILVESALSRTWKYIKNIRAYSFAQEYVHRRRHCLPDIYLQVNCFHFETDRNLKSQQIITYNEKVLFPYSECLDVSGDLNLPNLRSERPTKVELQYMFGFLDRESEQVFKLFKTSLVEKHTAKDKNIEIIEMMELSGLQEEKLCVISQERPPRWLHPACYWASSLLCLTFPYRYFFHKNTDYSFYLYVKLIRA